MDYTLAPYRQSAIESLTMRCVKPKLIARGFPDGAFGQRVPPQFAIRGLVVDKEMGNVIKMDRHGYVGRAYHGTKMLEDKQRKEVYRDQRLGNERERFVSVDTLFSLPEVTLFAQAIDDLEENGSAWDSGPASYSQLWSCIRESADEAHRDGSIKNAIRLDPADYIYRGAHLASTLHGLRSAGKRLFLLTNSEFSHTNVVMRFLLGDDDMAYPSWFTYFDWIVVSAGKPEFFTESRPFQELDRRGRPTGKPQNSIVRGRIYAHGNQLGLQASMELFPDEVLYVGDHIYDDIVKSKKSSGWRTALVVRELEHDLSVRSAWSTSIREIEHLHTVRGQLVQQISTTRYVAKEIERISISDLSDCGVDPANAAEMLQVARTTIQKRLEGLRRNEDDTSATLQVLSTKMDQEFNPYWGSLFSERHDTSSFGSQLEAFACIYTSRATNLLHATPEQYFHSPHGSLPHWQ